MPFELLGAEINQRKPLEIISGFVWDRDNEKYTLPFAAKHEAQGLLSGSESSTLVSRNGEPIFSTDFVECSAALVRNRQTGAITLIHQSLWSDSASVALGLQRTDDLDVITISDQSHGIRMKDIVSTHGIDPVQLGYMINPALERNTADSGVRFNRSEVLGLTSQEVADMFRKVNTATEIGVVRQVCDIRIPLMGRDGWDLLYRPKENIIWIYESNAKKLYKFEGF